MVDSGQKPIVGVIGLGSMGLGVAQSLRRAGFTTFGCDRRPEQLAALAAVGGRTAASPAELGAACDVVIVLVVNAAQTREVVLGETGCAQAMRPGGTVISSSTVAPTFAEELGERLTALRLRMLDAPVSGGMHRAAEGQLTIMASGAPQTFEAAEPVLSAIAQKVYRLGDRPGQGSKIKMVNQLLAGVHIAAAAEAMALGMRAGVDPEVLYEVISNSAGSSWMFQNRVPHILAGDYAPLSAVNIFVKDLGIVLESARDMTFPLPLTAAAHQQFLAASAAGHGAEDDSAVIKVFDALTPIELPKKKDQTPRSPAP